MSQQEHHHEEHEHNHHHHHHHGDACGCEECRQEEKLTVTTHLQDSAVVVSAHYRTVADPQELSALLTVNMESTAAKIYAVGGFIGHLKASADVHTVEMFSLTDREVYRKKGNDSEILVTVAAILFAIKETAAEELIKTMLEDIDKKVRK